LAASAERAADPLVAEIQRLGADHYQDREEAGRRLWNAGREALPRLREAAQGNNPEIARRARELVRKIEMEVTPDSRPEVLALVESYGRAPANQKVRLLYELRQYSAWRQILRLYADEKDPAVRGKSSGLIDSVAVEGAREQIAAGRPGEARQLLELAPADGAAATALAEFHRVAGTLDAELARAGDRPAWRLALLRSAGEAARVRAEATAAGNARVAAAFAMLEGDPVPWLETTIAEDGDGENGRHLYAGLARKHWSGGRLTSHDLLPLAAMVKSDDDSVRDRAIGLAFLLGQVEMGEEALLRADPRLAFAHYDQLERVPDALRALGLDPERPDFRAWIEKRFEPLLARKEDTDEPRMDLLAMANFLERRGLTEEAATYESCFQKLAEADAGEFTSMLGSLFNREPGGYAAVGLAGRIAAAYAKDDDGRWAEVIDNAFGEDAFFDDVWHWLGEIDPRAGRADRFAGMLALFRIGADPKHLREVWLGKLWAAVDRLPKDDARSKLDWLARIAVQAGDLDTGLRAWDRLGIQNEDEGELPTDGIFLLCLSAADRWQQAADKWLRYVEKNPRNPEFHAYAAACLRRAGKPDEAAKQDAWVEKLALGEASATLNIGRAYAYGGDFARANAWWERTLRIAPPGSEEWTKALEERVTERLDANDWKRAAAAAEVLAYESADFDAPGHTLPLGFLRLRANADFARALSRLEIDRAASLDRLAVCHRWLMADGSLADSFLPSVRAAGLVKEHDAWFEASWAALQRVIARYPRGGNTCNTAAWLAARACRRLDEAEVLVKRALDESPAQAAYLDTCGELWFARGNRKQAVEWSSRALASDPSDATLRRQHERFRSAPLPK